MINLYGQFRKKAGTVSTLHPSQLRSTKSRNHAVPALMALLLMVATSWATASLAASPAASPPQEAPAEKAPPVKGYDDLLTLFADWRQFARPPLLDGAPDYTAETTARRYRELKSYQQRLQAFNISGWPVARQVDWHLVRAEMNGMDFNIRVLKPWQRDPAFYTSVWTEQSDTPAHEGPTNDALVELWTYSFPLSADAERKLTAELRTIPPLLRQARANLTGNARELWVAGIENLRGQGKALAALANETRGGGDDFKAALGAAQTATSDFINWLEAQAPSKTGPSGVGKDNYNWLLRNVYLVPMTWDEEVTLLRRELDRARASLALEEHHNRSLPSLVVIASPVEYHQRAERVVKRFTNFLRDQDILPDYPYIESALEAHTGEFVPPGRRNFFATVAHHQLLALWTHWYHWFDHGHMDTMPNPSPVRRGPLLYNIWAYRSEGMATAFEEMTMHAGLFDDEPRARELVWIMLAARAARGLGSLYAQANIFTLQQARDFHVANVPRGWMRADLDLLGFEQLLYLRQPGYGASYVTGKSQIERLLGEMHHRAGKDFRLSEFFRQVDDQGVIPVSLIEWQLTGDDTGIRGLMPDS